MPDSGYIPASPEAKDPSGVGKGTHNFATLFSPLGGLCLDQTKRFLDIQARLLRYGHAMTNAWFDRHQKSTAANFEAAARLGECRDGVEFVDLYHRWSTETFVQLVDDAHDGATGWMGLLQALTVAPQDEKRPIRSQAKPSDHLAKERAI
jgi:hypothetical protein